MTTYTGPFKIRRDGQFLTDPFGKVYEAVGLDHARNLAYMAADRHSCYIIDIPSKCLVLTVRPEDVPPIYRTTVIDYLNATAGDYRR